MKHTEILQPTLGDLEFDRNAYLFNWSGALIEGVGMPIAFSEPEAVTNPPLSSWKYGRYNSNTAPMVDRTDRTNFVPQESLSELRSRIPVAGARITREESTGVARATVAAAFDMGKISISHVENPYGKYISVPDVLEAITADVEYWDGAAWVLNSIALQSMGIELLTPTFVQVLGIEAAIEVVKVHCLHRKQMEYLEAIVAQFVGGEVAQLRSAYSSKLSHIKQQLELWVNAGKTPVLSSDGRINQVLTISNCLTASIATKKLYEMAIGYGKFMKGVKDLCEAIDRVLSS